MRQQPVVIRKLSSRILKGIRQSHRARSRSLDRARTLVEELLNTREWTCDSPLRQDNTPLQESGRCSNLPSLCSISCRLPETDCPSVGKLLEAFHQIGDSVGLSK